MTDGPESREALASKNVALNFPSNGVNIELNHDCQDDDRDGVYGDNGDDAFYTLWIESSSLNDSQLSPDRASSDVHQRAHYFHIKAW